MITDTTFLHLEETLDTTIFDHLRVMADRLDDMDEVMLAHAYRWLAARKKIPYPRDTNWHYWRWTADDIASQPPDTLPLEVYFSNPSIEHNYINMATAYRAAAEAIVHAAREKKGPLAYIGH